MLIAKVGKSKELLKLFLLHFVSIFTSVVPIECLIRLNSIYMKQSSKASCMNDIDSDKEFAHDILLKCKSLNVIK